MRKRICVITGSRAEYGILYPLLKKIDDDAAFTLHIIAAGAHLCPEFGSTYKEIERDGFAIYKRVPTLLSDDTREGVTLSIGKGVADFGKVLSAARPDAVVLLGDRSEIFAAAIAAFVLQIPIFHIHGGELTEGAIDDAFRHSITKMSSYSFVATDIYRRRVIQLGESPDRVFNVGSLGLDNIKIVKFLSKDELARRFRIKFSKRNLLVTFHPVTLGRDSSTVHFRQLLRVLDGLKDTSIFFTKANADAGGREINHSIEKYVSRNSHKASFHASLGRLGYLSMMRYVDAVVGNSSSGIIEAPSFKIATINIGDRQKGRVRAASIVDCKPTEENIAAALKKIYSVKFKEGLKRVVNPYGTWGAASKILKILKSYPLGKGLAKAFYDLPYVSPGKRRK